MLFRRHKSARLHPANSIDGTHVASTVYRTPKTLEEILAASEKSALSGPRSHVQPHSSSSSRSGDSSDSKRTRAPRSRKTGYATIHTDATDKHAAFESDAFAVHMPTTRIPIMGNADRSARPSPAAEAEAYRTYREKARQVRERNNSQGVRVPAKLISYGAVAQEGVSQKTPVKISSSHSSPPAGSFPISPPLPQNEWSTPERQHRTPVQGPRSLNEPSKPHPLCKPVESETVTPNRRYRYRADSVAGASCSTSSPTIKVRLIPKLTVQEIDRVQTESRYSLYTRSSPSSTATSRSSSPSKSLPNFIRRDSLEGDSIFGYRVKDIVGTAAGSSSMSGSDRDEKSKTAAKGKKTTPKRSPTSRWAWLKSPPRSAKPTVPPTSANPGVSRDPIATQTPPPPTPPFLRTPTSRPASPKKLVRPAPPTPTGKFDSGFAQIKRLALLLVKIAVALYAIVALWFVLDAVRQAFYTLGAPFRVLRFLGGTAWIWGSWACRVVVVMWEKWGFKVALKGGWMWKMRW